MEVKTMMITPELAKRWISKSKGNPRWANQMYDHRRVDIISKDIVNGNWNPGNGAIVFDEKDTLVDGHHRLAAIIKAEIPVESIVIFGVTEKGLVHIDDQKTRTIAQRTKIESAIVSVANFHMVCHGSLSNGVSASAAAIQKWYSDHPLAETAVRVVGKGTHGTISRKSAIVCAALEALESGVSEEILKKFFKSVNTGFTESVQESAAVVLRNMIISNNHTKREIKMSLYLATQDAIFDYVNGIKRVQIYTKPKGVYMK